jgi:hypothetical protein
MCVLPVLLVSFFRRRFDDFVGMSRTVNAVYTIFYGFTNYWSFQYLAWSLPFWLTSRKVFAVTGSVLAGSYIYGLYWLLCGNPALLGEWDFAAHFYWPVSILLLRDLTVLFFFVAAWIFLVTSILQGFTRWKL